jgi:Zn-dependent peptidase ImmA (M78 family)
MIRRKYIRELVSRLLNQFDISKAPIPVEEIAKGLGAQVQYEAADPGLSGFVFRDPGTRTPIIGVNKKHHRNRQRFTIAHEIGHLLLHEGDKLRIDHKNLGFEVKIMGSKAAEHPDDLEERAANIFAAELLMPRQFLERDVRNTGGVNLLDDDVVSSLAKDYGVSTQALTYRLIELSQDSSTLPSLNRGF